jgi:hypothetical protein
MERMVLGVMILGQMYAFVSATFDVKQFDTGRSILSYQTEPRGRALVREYVGPVGMLGIAVIAFLALILGDEESRTVHAILAYLHLVIGGTIAYYFMQQNPHFISGDDTLSGSLYHIGVSCFH